MTEFLDSFRPSFLDETPAVETSRAELVVDVVHADGSRFVLFRAGHDGIAWTGLARLDHLLRFLSDIEDSLTGQPPIGSEVATVEGGADAIEVPIGQLIVTGRLDEWRAMIERELATAPDEPGAVPESSSPWIGDRVPIAVGEAE